MAHHDGQFDNMLTSSKPNIEPSRQPPNIQRLVAVSKKSPNAVNVEFSKKYDDAHLNLMKNPPNLDDDPENLKTQANIQAFNELYHDYETGNDPNSENDADSLSNQSDDNIYDEIMGDISNDFGQAPGAEDFSMFSPAEQDATDQMFSDIDAINAENPYTDEPDTDPFTMDDLEKIAEPDDNQLPSESSSESIDDAPIPDIPE